MTIDQRIRRLEKATGYVKGRVPGTQLVRTLTPTSIEWCLALGVMQQYWKPMFSGKTIEECLKKAEKEFGLRTHRRKKNVTRNAMIESMAWNIEARKKGF